MSGVVADAVRRAINEYSKSITDSARSTSPHAVAGQLAPGKRSTLDDAPTAGGQGYLDLTIIRGDPVTQRNQWVTGT
jgi:hypothetical protein